MKQLNMNDVFEYAENHIAVFHQQRLDAVSQKIDFNKLIELFVSKINSGNLDEINEVLKFVNAVWNYFPHKSLKGLSPVEKLKERS